MSNNTPTDAPSGLRDAACSPSDYDAGLLNDFGGGDVGWWQDYLRAEIGRANDYWRELYEGARDNLSRTNYQLRDQRDEARKLAKEYRDTYAPDDYSLYLSFPWEWEKTDGGHDYSQCGKMVEVANSLENATVQAIRTGAPADNE